ncbi:hypothetical protein JOQ06_020073 [Pogonophryne albipinna]|uniref:USP domain-containing protein n=1 Tax=Pogonophryne albipinna TaxID=1090488 RepID=A0AAD6BSB5_9TELE|nr:hypothetical protein JOQ06_020073 [Pogonophryne albipinna]
MDLYKSSRQFVSNMWSPPAIKYHGLENQGSTCYLNSVLQVLFMTKDFREAVEGHISANPDTEHIDLQLESLFGDLKSYPAYTYKITKKLGINKVYEQQDAAEYFEKILAKTSDDASKIFHGQLTHKTTCSSCGTETDAAGPFWNLPLALMASCGQNFSVVNGIEKYFRESSLNGENQMYCEKCDDKSDATTKCVINHHPEVLMLLLKRFEFDYYSMRYVKINCTVDVPCTLQIPENQPYELYAMVDHFGDLSRGNYIATIKPEDDGRWHSFNDRCVTEVNNQPFQLGQVEKSDSAYLLFYRKKKVHAADTQDTREESTQCQDGVEKTAGAGCTNAVDVSIDNNLQTGFSNYVNDECRRSSYLSSSEDRPIGGYNSPNIQQECNEERKDMRYHLQDAEKQRDKGEMIASDEEAMTGIAEAENQTKKTEILSRETEESVDDQGKDSARPDDVSHRKSQEGDDIHNMSCHDYKQGVSDMHPQNVDMQKDEEQMAVEGHEDGWIKDDAQSERRGIDYPNRFPEHQYHEELYYVKQDMYKDEMGTQEVEGKDVPKPVIIRYYNEDKERTSGTRKLSTKYDPCYERVGDTKQSKSKISRLYQSPEQQREEMDVKGDLEQERGGDKQAQRRETSERHQHFGQDRDDHIYRRSDAGQSSSEHFAQTTQTDVHVTETQDGDRMEGRFDSEKALHLHQRIPAEEISKTHSGDEKRSERRNLIDAGEGTSHARVSSCVEYDRGHSESLSGPKTDAKVTLPEKVSKLNLKDFRTKGMSVAQEQAVGIIHAKKRKGVKKIKLRRSSSPLKQKGSKKKKHTFGWFSSCLKGRKNADQTSESD